jgi:hypothetical protein
MKMKNDYFVEVTDTYGGEANYCWVNRYKVRASSMMGAARRVAHQGGYEVRKDYNTGDMARYNAKGECVCMFVEHYDSDNHSRYLNVKEM